jgi:aryl-alcohol dehydrogenase-like predicted oxidoreductase
MENRMKKRKLGRSGLEVSAIGFGAMGMSQSYGPAGPREEMIGVLRAAFERGRRRSIAEYRPLSL